ncbi:MAG: phospholipase [Actinobacteria bacterium 13_2_20CM_2_71_6]|nr:MAG: phospholipase [Actinobacteria bacterium 13_2_20CM_2_71_6]
MTLARWFLTGVERGNPQTGLDRRRPDGLAWSTGNEVRPLVHGRTYFAELLAGIRAARAGDLVLFTDWRGDPDERLAGPGTEVSRVLCEAAERGVLVKGLIWRSHLDRLYFSAAENRHLDEEIEGSGGEVMRDMRVRVGGSHHQKIVVLRYPGRPDLDVAYVGGIDLCHGRNDDAEHLGDPQSIRMSPRYGDRPPWHDIQLAIRGPAVGDPDPPRRGTHAVQVLRTYPYRRPGYPFAPRGERSVARGYAKALRRAERLIYLEDQYLWSAQVADSFATALREHPELRLIAVVPLYPDQPGSLADANQIVGRGQALDTVYRAGGDRVAVYSLENHAGTPVYVHAKVCVVDDTWMAVGSDNFNVRSWTHDSELSCAVLDEATSGGGDPAGAAEYAGDPAGEAGAADHGGDPAGEAGAADHGGDPAGEAGAADHGGDPAGLPRSLRLALAREHLDRSTGDDADLVDAEECWTSFAKAADELEAWYAGGRVGSRPPGRLRRYRPPPAPGPARTAATVLYPVFFDPDGRPPALRRRHAF